MNGTENRYEWWGRMKHNCLILDWEVLEFMNSTILMVALNVIWGNVFNFFFRWRQIGHFLTDALKFDEVESLHEKESDFSSWKPS